MRNVLLLTGLIVTIAAGQTPAPAIKTGEPRIKVIKLAVANVSAAAHPAEDIVISVADLKKIAPNFKPASMIVTTSDASTLEEDARILQTIELPSQADDLDGDNKVDEIAFQIDLKARQTRIVTIAYGDQYTI